MRFLQLNSYTSPKIVENKQEDWVEYGADNNYYQYLIDLYHGSPTNNAAVKGIADLIFGEGLEAVKADRNLQGYLETKKLFRDDCLRKISLDLKMLGQASFQLIKSKNRKKYAMVKHWPIQTLRPEKANKEGEVEAYWYSPDWTRYKEKGFEPVRVAAFGYDDNATESIYCMKPYSTGNHYFSPVDYQGGLQYAELEQEVANYHLNNIKNGLAPSMLINFHNGIPPEEEQDEIERDITRKFTGSSNSGRFILAFNDSRDSSASLEPVQLSEASSQYEFLSAECMRKVMVAHRITSPMLLGIKDQTGLGNNADELRTASTLFDNIVIRPFQRIILDALDDVLAYNGVSIDLYFKTLQPLEFTDLNNNAVDQETREKETGVTLSSQDLHDDDAHAWLDYLADKGEVIDENEWQLMEEVPVTDYDEDDKRYNFYKQYAEPQDKSSQDRGLFKVRYAYAPKRDSSNSREFCSRMVNAARSGVVYRKEDILQMGDQGVNGQFAPKGRSTYSIWLWKGGAYCHHYWTRKVYFRKRGDGGQFLPKSETAGLENERPSSVSEAVSKGAPLPKNPTQVATKPIDTPSKGKLN